MYKYVLSLLCVVSVGHIPTHAVAQNLGGGYLDCSCVTPAVSTGASTGAITSSIGDVLVDGVSSESNNIINSSSQILVGEGSASITVGLSCQMSIPNNTQVTVSQPGGAGSNLCIQELHMAVAQEEASAGAGAGNAALVGTLVVAGAITAVVVASSNGGDDNANNNAVVRPAASN